MDNASWKTTVLILLAAVIVLITYVVLDAYGSVETLSSLMTALAPTSALLFGLLGVNLFGRTEPMNGDRFRALGLWLGLGLIVLTLAEIAGVILITMGTPEMVCFTVGLVQLPGFLLWGLGVIGYLQSVNQSLDKIRGDRLWPILVFVSIMGSLGLMAGAIIGVPGRSPLTILVSAPTVLWFSIIFAVILWLAWTFRNGHLVRPMLLLLIGISICLVRGILWLTTDICDGGAIDDLLASEAYFLIGAALAEAASISITG
jgi:hypothetical protein